MADDDPTDDQLLDRFIRGDGGALGALAERYERPLLGLAAGLLDGRAELARDAVQESWVRVIRHARAFKGQSSVKTWLYRIVINRCRDMRAQSASSDFRLKEVEERAQPGGAPEPALLLGRAEDNGRVRSAVAGLPGPTRLLLLLCYHKGLTHEQAADILGIPVGTLKSRLHTALESLRSTLPQEVRHEPR